MAYEDDLEKQSYNNYQYHLQPFKFWTLQNFPFIESADFDSLTNYEIMCKIVDYLNNVIANMNTAESNDEITQTNITNAINYINNYFDNLDVTEDINNKLDEMTQDGTLSNIISSYIDPLINDQNTEIQNFKTTVNNEITTQNNRISLIESGAPLVVDSTDDMTDTSRIYVNTTNGNWYFYDGDSWEIGGTYQSTGIAEGSINILQLDNILQKNYNIEYDDWEDLPNHNTGYATISNNTLAFGDDNNFYYYEISLTAGDIINVNGWDYFNCVGIIIVDSDNNILYHTTKGLNTQTAVSKTFLVNETGLKLYISRPSIDTSSNYIYKLEFTAGYRKVKAVYNNLLISTNTTLLSTIEDRYSASSTVGNRIVITDDTNAVMYVYAMNKGQKYHITGHSIYAVKGFIIVDSTWNIIEASNTSNVGSTSTKYEKTFVANTDGFIVFCDYNEAGYSIEVIVDSIDIKASTSPLYGKKLYVAGDSISVGTDADSTQDGTKMTYDWFIKTRNNMTVTKDAISGSTLCPKDGRTDAFTTARYLSMPLNYDYYIFQFGTNDTVNAGDLTDTTNSTFAGGINFLCNYLLSNNPTAKILFIPVWWGDNARYNISVRASQYNGIRCIEWSNPSNPVFLAQQYDNEGNPLIKESILTNQLTTYTADNTHPNGAGHEYISAIVEKYLQEL